MAMRIRQFMSAPVVTVAPTTDLRGALDLMHARRIHHLPVRDGDRIVGIVAEHDLLLAAANFGTTELPVAEIMKRPVTCIGADSTVQQAAKLLVRKRIRSLPVLDRKKALVGIITETDIFKIMAGLHAGARAAPSRASRAGARQAPKRSRAAAKRARR
jgi:CBS domain-containing protein